jgi:hypothetical protein
MGFEKGFDRLSLTDFDRNSMSIKEFVEAAN